MAYKHTNLMRLSDRDIHNKLLERNLPQIVCEEIKQTIKEQKEHRRKASLHARTMELYWGELISPLVHERKIVRSIMRHKASIERGVALDAYLAVLNKLYDRLTILKTSSGLTPEQGHWVDYVPLHIKQRVIDLFEAIPHTPKAKAKIPFERRVPAIQHNKQLGRLQRRTMKELRNAESSHLVNPTEQGETTINNIRLALDMMKRMTPTDAVPLTWHGLL
jgi:hypothetical protein